MRVPTRLRGRRRLRNKRLEGRGDAGHATLLRRGCAPTFFMPTIILRKSARGVSGLGASSSPIARGAPWGGCNTRELLKTWDKAAKFVLRRVGLVGAISCGGGVFAEYLL